MLSFYVYLATCRESRNYMFEWQKVTGVRKGQGKDLERNLTVYPVVTNGSY